MIEVIYIRGGDINAPLVALESGMHYGIRHDYKSYGDVYMLDINWKRYDWAQYIGLVCEHEPIQAMVADYEQPSQRLTMLNQVADIARFNVRPIVCVKFLDAVKDVPEGATIGISVPTSYAGFLPNLGELKGREIHILGGSPDVQADLITKINGEGGNVVSTDLNYHARKAQHGQFYDGSRWIQCAKNSHHTLELTIISGINIVKKLQSLTATQCRLF